MEILPQIILLMGGLLILAHGAKLLVVGTSNLAYLLGISPLIIATTIIAFGTSLPELSVSVFGVLKGSSGIAVGNIVGSNIANIALVLGACLLFVSLKIEMKKIKRELFFVTLASLLFSLFSLDGALVFYEGLILLTALMFFIGFYIRLAIRKDPILSKEVDLEEVNKEGNYLKDIFFIAMGLALLLGSGEIITSSGIKIASFYGIAQTVIGTSLIAIGTSLPELATALMAIKKKKFEISIGTALGSNIWNLLLIGGIISLPSVHIDDKTLYFSLPVMLFFSLLFIPLAQKNTTLRTKAGVSFIAAYLIFLLFLYSF